MMRISASLGTDVRLVQKTKETTITITHSKWGVVVDRKPTIQIGRYDLYYYDFRPSFSGTYLISWNQALPDYRWEVMDVLDINLWDLYTEMNSVNSEKPSAKTG